MCQKEVQFWQWYRKKRMWQRNKYIEFILTDWCIPFLGPKESAHFENNSSFSLDFEYLRNCRIVPLRKPYLEDTVHDLPTPHAEGLAKAIAPPQYWIARMVWLANVLPGIQMTEFRLLNIKKDIGSRSTSCFQQNKTGYITNGLQKENMLVPSEKKVRCRYFPQPNRRTG